MARKKLTQTEWFEHNGFTKEGVTYAVFGDTFTLKDTLKENGFKFNYLIMWHTNNPSAFELPEGYVYVPFRFDDLYIWNDTFGCEETKTKAKVFVQETFAPFYGEDPSDYMGEVGERLRDLPATYLSTSGFDSAYGYKLLHKFKVQDNILCWFTTKGLSIVEGSQIKLTGTVVKHTLYKGVKSTTINRCIIK